MPGLSGRKPEPRESRRPLTLGLTPRIVGLVALTALVSGSLIAYLGVRNSRDALKSQILADAQTQADLVAGMTDSYLESARDPLEKLAKAPYTTLALHQDLHKEMQTILAIVNASQPGFQNVSLYDGQGNAIARAVETTPATNTALREWFVGGKATKAPYTGLALTSAASGRPVVPLAVPILDGAGDVLAMIVGTLSLDAVADTLDFAERGSVGRVTLVDRREGATVLAQHDTSRILQPLETGVATRKVIFTGSRSALATKDAGGKGTLAAVTPLSDLPWTVVVEQPSESAFASIGALTRKTSLLAGAIILAGCLLSALVALQITRPLSRLRRAAQSLAEGNLTSRLALSQRDEVGELGRAFDTMAQNLEERTGELVDAVHHLSTEVNFREQAEAELRMAHDELEVRVEERTVELASANQELSRSNRELEQFAYVASHDLQEPLRMVGNYTQLLSRRYKGKLDQDADDFIGFAVEGAQRMQQLINDLLDYSRINTKGKDLEPVESEAALSRALTNLQVAIEESGTRIERKDLPTIVGDHAQIVQLFQNLIGNAIKFRGDKAPVIEVGVEAQGDSWLFWVRDNGIGIDAQYFDRIFILFQRLHTRDEYAGTGIGLSICKRIVDRHAGRIWVESSPGTGTTFYFTLKAAGAASLLATETDLVVAEVA